MTTPQQLDDHVRAELAALAVPRRAGTAPGPAAGDTRAGAAGPAAGGPAGDAVPGDPGVLREVGPALFEAQATSRQLDLTARWLRGTGRGYYTIGSAGHEGNAAVALALRPDDPVLAHYRSGAFYCARAARSGTVDPVDDVLRGLLASAAEPIAGGRHKVFGHPDLAVIPTTSTIASHLPRAVGLAFAIGRSPATGLAARRAGRDHPAARGWPEDAIVMASFGDASVNHATATAALNTAGWCAHSGLPLPLLLVCEDNGLGISVRSPGGWVSAALSSRPGLRYLAADGCDAAAAYVAAREAVGWVRRHRRPAVLHLDMVRFLGHAGADAEAAYRTPAELAADLARDPLVNTARQLVAAGLADPAEPLERYLEIGRAVRERAEELASEPTLAGAAEVMAPLATRRPVRVARAVADAAEAATAGVRPPGAGRIPAPADRAAAFGGRLPEAAGPVTLAQSINAALADGLLTYPGMIVFGEDVAAKGGVYGVTKGLLERFGARRVFDTLLDETSILGLALGAGLHGMLPVPEIQYLAYLHNAEDQLRGEAASIGFFSRGAYRNPMVVRVAGLAYQRGFGGHFHNDNALAVLRDIPGLVVGCPARPDDAAAMLRTCLAAARVDGSVCVQVEPIALYHTRDLNRPGDGWWLSRYAPPERWAATHVPIGRARVYPVGSGEDLTIVTFGNGVRMSLRVAGRLAARGVGVRVVDLRWLLPLPVLDLVRESAATGRVLVVDETRRSGGVGEGVVAALVEAGHIGLVRRIAAQDSYLPLGPAAGAVLVDEEAVEQAARAILAR